MTNDAKLGMLAGVIGVVVAAVFFAKPPAQPVTTETQTKQQPAPLASAPSAPPTAPLASAPSAAPTATPEAGIAALPSTPVARTRKDVPAQPASRQPGADEEP